MREKRTDEGLSVRQAANSAGISFSTLSRVEGGSQPDLVTFLNLCVWLGLPPDHFYREFPKRPDVSTVDKVVKHLSSDPRLSKDAASKIASVVKDLYSALAKELEPPPTLAMHLRASSVMRPGVPERLVGVLRDMHSALEQRLREGTP